MTILSYRRVKGTPLTNDEVDDNFLNLENAKANAANAALTGTTTAANITATGTVSATGGFTGNVSGTAANVTGTIAVVNGGTGATTAAAALSALGAQAALGFTPYNATNPNGYITSAGTAANVTNLSSAQVTTALGYAPVQQGTGVGQNTDAVKIGWTSGGGLKLTVITGDQGYFPMSSTGPGTFTYAGAITASGVITATGGFSGNLSGTATSATNATNATNANNATNATTAASANALNNANHYQMGGLGVGTAASATDGEIRATNNITSFYSDRRLKTNVRRITFALNKIDSLGGYLYEQNELASSFGYNNFDTQVGVIAQDVQAVQPEAIALAPFDIDEFGNSKSGENYLTVRYERLIPLLIEGIKELRLEIEMLKDEIHDLKEGL